MKCVFGVDGFLDLVGMDRMFVNFLWDLVIICFSFFKIGVYEFEWLIVYIYVGEDVKVMYFCIGCWFDLMEFVDWEILNEVWFYFWCDYELFVGFLLVGCKFC